MPCSIAVVGAGLVGCLQALYLSERGHHVVVFEKRQDLRKDETQGRGRSINLALSTRGRAALRHVGLEEAVLKVGVPVYGRMVHDLNGKTSAMAYGVLPDEHNYAIDRRTLNCLLLDAIERKGVTIYFDHRLTSASFDDDDLTLTFVTGDEANEEITFEEFDFIFGCDGVYSALRGRVVESTCANLEIKHIEHGYRELFIAPTEDGEPALDQNYLHLWARSEFMLMALPNPDNSFTATLFMPMKIFDEINNDEKLTAFFEKQFPDAIPLLGGPAGLVEQFKIAKEKPGRLASIRLNPHHTAQGRVLLMGDAAHGMVPFYAQGMNSGFEDCHVLDEAIDDELKRSGETSASKEVMKRAILAYSKQRVIDAAAICDLAEYNYVEMRNFVNLWWFRWRKSFDHTIYRMLGARGSWWIPLYASVSYTRMPYGECRQNREWQDATIRRTKIAALVLAGAVVAGCCYRPIAKNLHVKWGSTSIFN